MKSKKAFTLIELLVVIAIIAALMAIILPALKKVKKQAAAVVCLSNMRQLITSWTAYSMDNDEEMVNGQVPRQVFAQSHFWVEAPQDNSGTYTGDKAITGTKLPVSEEQNGIQKGLLYPYVGAFDAYHCPANASDKMGWTTSQLGSFWNSYSVTGMMNGEDGKQWAELRGVANPQPVTDYHPKSAFKLSEVSNPGTKLVMLENGDDRGWLMGSWLMNTDVPTQPRWNDPFAIWHGDVSPLGFADGHAENHKWQEPSTVENAKQNGTFVSDPINLSPSEPEDVTYMGRIYNPKP